MKSLFILGEVLLRWNIISAPILTTKSDLPILYPNKNHSLKLTFNILKPNINQFFQL